LAEGLLSSSLAIAGQQRFKLIFSLTAASLNILIGD
jgi:hypothetical protein